ncbi:diaminopimelate dehydrogenase [Tomitella cavernea]|uniref:Meso-diaminopimelate D-dehydrogenase n=1 Tax=Tomitella cavernea TaxID=1387982 RepID=A0ABP9CTC2_9ACTN|nr:diaminopimelate dehydrogenase [Tomitella cavernea]
MGEKIRIGIAGYGNLGRGVEAAVARTPDMELVGVFTRRDPAAVTPQSDGTRVYGWDALARFEGAVDVLILCGGSKEDLPQQGPELAARFTTVDSFDTHARIPEYFASVDGPARAAGTTAVISTGWDPGLFSLNRVLGESILPSGETYTFWGRGVSQGHSDAVRKVPGVAAGVQYTIPSEQAVEAVRRGDRPELSTRDKHVRECFVVLEDGADAETVREAIVTMPHYFEPYDTTVHFITADELARDHAGIPHGGFVIRSGETGPADDSSGQVYEFSLKLGSNPGFTSSVLVAYARAAHRMNARGDVGAKTLYDVAPGLLSPKTPEQLRAEDL